MEDFELYFRDLTKEAQKRLLQACQMKNPRQLNWDVIPLALIAVDEIIWDYKGVEDGRT